MWVSNLVKSATLDVFGEYFPQDREEEEDEELQLRYDLPPYKATNLASIKDPSKYRR
jgi:hypothetical protein